MAKDNKTKAKPKPRPKPKPKPKKKPVDIAAGNGGRKPRRAPQAGSVKRKQRGKTA